MKANIYTRIFTVTMIIMDIYVSSHMTIQVRKCFAAYMVNGELQNEIVQCLLPLHLSSSRRRIRKTGGRNRSSLQTNSSSELEARHPVYDEQNEKGNKGNFT